MKKSSLLSCVSALMLLAACETPPVDDGSVSANGMNAGEEGAVGEYGYNNGTVTPGSQEDLVANVGDRVFFGFDSAVLSSDGERTLERQAAWLQANPAVSVMIEGHCDERGTREYNLALGERRAAAAKRYLVGLGVPTSRVNTVSYGKERPAVIGDSEAAWSQNRRSVTVVQ